MKAYLALNWFSTVIYDLFLIWYCTSLNRLVYFFLIVLLEKKLGSKVRISLLFDQLQDLFEHLAFGYALWLFACDIQHQLYVANKVFFFLFIESIFVVASNRLRLFRKTEHVFLIFIFVFPKIHRTDIPVKHAAWFIGKNWRNSQQNWRKKAHIYILKWSQKKSSMLSLNSRSVYFSRRPYVTKNQNQTKLYYFGMP